MFDIIRSLISERFAVNSLLLIFSLVTVFHLLVLVGIIPFEIVWGGRLKNADQMIVFESVSILLNVIMLLVVCLYSGLVRLRVNQKIITVALWLMTILFLVNTIGNLFSSNQTEKIIFTPLTVMLCVFCFRLAIGRKNAAPSAENRQ